MRSQSETFLSSIAHVNATPLHYELVAPMPAGAASYVTAIQKGRSEGGLYLLNLFRQPIA
jgi:hypothetical protein